MKQLLITSSVVLSLVLSACGGNLSPEASTEKNSATVSQAQALETVKEVPNFRDAAEALKASDDSLLIGKATLTSDSERLTYSTLVIKSEKGEHIIEASFNQQKLESLTLLSLPNNTAVDLLQGTVQKFNSQRSSLVDEGLWNGTKSLKELTSTDKNAEGTELEPLAVCPACNGADIAAGAAQADLNIARLEYYACAMTGTSDINCLTEAVALDRARAANEDAQAELDDCIAANCGGGGSGGRKISPEKTAYRELD